VLSGQWPDPTAGAFVDDSISFIATNDFLRLSFQHVAPRPSDGGAADRDGEHLGVAFLLAQLGAHATERMSERLKAIGLTPAHIGLLRLIAGTPGQSQRAVAERLGVHPSRIVALVDDLERQGFVERRRSREDRRLYALHPAPGAKLREIARIAAAHEHDISAALSPEERVQLRGLLVRVARQQGLTPGVHPGYRHLRGRGGPPERRDGAGP
jgi:DNA-binding MarR family transcriptional regulator